MKRDGIKVKKSHVFLSQPNVNRPGWSFFHMPLQEYPASLQKKQSLLESPIRLAYYFFLKKMVMELK